MLVEDELQQSGVRALATNQIEKVVMAFIDEPGRADGIIVDLVALYPGEVAEMALAHTVSDKVESAYRRGDLLVKRHQLMRDWAEFCGTSIVPEVVPLLRRAKL